LVVVRYSPREINIKDNIGTDHIIRFYKDEREFDHWVGGGTEVITFAQDMKHRGEYLNVMAFQQLVDGFNARVYGPKNDQMGPLNGGFLSYEGMKQKMRDARVYVYTGTQPAAYTLGFIEALMTGIPVVAVGPKYGNSLNIAGDTYEIPDIIHDGVNGYVSDDLEYLRQCIGELIKDKRTARRISAEGRKTALELFSKSFIKQQWGDLLCK
jgi:glycosyltransferase involved in cell wall biosynthesis